MPPGRLERKAWTSSAIVRRYLNELATGNPECDWVTWVEWKHLPAAVGRALVVGCGSGWLERGLAARGRVKSIVACDASEEAVSLARAHARAEDPGASRIEHRVLDLERDDPGGPFDVIFVHEALGRIPDLEGAFGRLHGALAPGGKIVLREYVGPNRFQYTDDQMDLVNRYFRLIPDELRRDNESDRILWRRERSDLDRMLHDDPAAAARSEDVLPVARATFRTEREYPSGGGLLNPLLSGIIGNFREDVPRHQHLLQALCEAEARLSEAGAMKPDFVTYVGSRAEAV